MPHPTFDRGLITIEVRLSKDPNQEWDDNDAFVELYEQIIGLCEEYEIVHKVR